MRKAIVGALLLSAAVAPACAQSVIPVTAPHFVSVSQSSVLSSNLVGLNVTNAGGQTIGAIKDVVLAADRSIEGVVVSVCGFLGMGEHYIVIDPAAVAVSYDTNDKKWLARMNATADQLKAVPPFTYEGKWKSWPCDFKPRPSMTAGVISVRGEWIIRQ